MRGRIRFRDHWFVMFFPSDVPKWWMWWARWVRLDYRHLAMVRYDEEKEVFVALEIFSGGGHMKILEPYQFVIMQNHATEVLSVMSEVNPYSFYFPRIFTCVSCCKHLLGYFWPTVITPWQLRCTLLKKAGATKHEPDYLDEVKNGHL